ncbi:MAG: hypothetical protein PHP98_04085 [Kiritimatiellae bacterium]|nr:hypothetical protein [Kiritimatiellia bacterium]
MISPRADHFLSEEDLDLRNMTREELLAWWQLWLEQAQATNDLDRDEYSHGVFRRGPRAKTGADQHDPPPARNRIHPAGAASVRRN